jgi:Fe-S cluster biogenesis protein NfuA
MSTSEAAIRTDEPILERIGTALDSIRPALQSDGGDVELVGFSESDGVVQIRLVGACGPCPISSMTVKHGIERRIRAAVPEVSEVQAI